MFLISRPSREIITGSINNAILTVCPTPAILDCLNFQVNKAIHNTVLFQLSNMAEVPNPNSTRPGDSLGTNGVTMNGNAHDNSTGPSIPIAIVGMACRFSGNVRNSAQLWELCANGNDGWSPIPDSRFDVKSLYHPNGSKAGRVSF